MSTLYEAKAARDELAGALYLYPDLFPEIVIRPGSSGYVYTSIGMWTLIDDGYMLKVCSDYVHPDVDFPGSVKSVPIDWDWGLESIAIDTTQLAADLATLTP